MLNIRTFSGQKIVAVKFSNFHIVQPLLWIMYSVETSEFFCYSDLSWKLCWIFYVGVQKLLLLQIYRLRILVLTNFSTQKIAKFNKIKLQSLKNIEIAIFGTSETPKIDFTKNLTSSKFLKFPIHHTHCGNYRILLPQYLRKFVKLMFF